MASGVIYVLINPALKGLLKIGKTTRTAEERAAKISSATGVPTKFLVVYEDFVEDCDLAERRIHYELSEYRYMWNREFFELKSSDALRVVMRVIAEVNDSFKLERAPNIEQAAIDFQLPGITRKGVSVLYTSAGSAERQQNSLGQERLNEVILKELFYRSLSRELKAFMLPAKVQYVADLQALTLTFAVAHKFHRAQLIKRRIEFREAAKVIFGKRVSIAVIGHDRAGQPFTTKI